MENLESRYPSCDKNGATFDNEATFVVVKSDQLKRAWVTLFLRDEVRVCLCVYVRVCECEYVCVCVWETSGLYLWLPLPTPFFANPPTRNHRRSPWMRCQDPVWDFSPDGKDRFAQPTIREQTFTQPGRNSKRGTVTAFKAQKHTARKKPIQITYFIPKTQRFWFYQPLEYTPTFF